MTIYAQAFCPVFSEHATNLKFNEKRTLQNKLHTIQKSKRENPKIKIRKIDCHFHALESSAIV